MWSLLSWERGLKYLIDDFTSFDNVAPLVGAWIEIPFANAIVFVDSGRSSRGSVD